jgi:regulator of cell morphogenesis and NO signaling
MHARQAELTVADLVRDRDDRREVLETFGIDLDCAALLLRSACTARGACFEEVRRAVTECDDLAGSSQTDWASASMTNLANHIVAWHHAYLREQLPRLRNLLDKVAARHGRRHPHLFDLQQIYRQFADQLLKHLIREELILFPSVRALDEAVQLQQSNCLGPGGRVRHAIQVMRDDHRTIASLLARMRKLTFGFRPPGDASRDYRELLDSLEGLESDLQRGIHKEDDLLFPCAAAAEESLLAIDNRRHPALA